MLPAMVLITGKRKRAKAIGQQLKTSNYDLIIFQESFLKAARKRIKKQLNDIFPYQIGPANQKRFTAKTNSGIWIISKTPITEIQSIIFKEKYGLDNKMARKGALMIEGEKEGIPFQIIGTHLNAGGPFAIRESQVQQIKEELIDPYTKEGVFQIICGDFNIDKAKEAHYQKTLDILDAEDGDFNKDLSFENHFTCGFQTSDFSKKEGHRPKVIDFIFIRKNNTNCHSVDRCLPQIESNWRKKMNSLSDHRPVEGRFLFKKGH